MSSIYHALASSREGKYSPMPDFLDLSSNGSTALETQTAGATEKSQTTTNGETSYSTVFGYRRVDMVDVKFFSLVSILCV